MSKDIAELEKELDRYRGMCVKLVDDKHAAEDAMHKAVRDKNKFEFDIVKMNLMYDLPVELVPKIPTTKEILNFHSILAEELDEVYKVFTLVELADLLGDLVVYIFSEARKFGIPLFEVLEIIMQSNFSKLGEDGKPIKDERGKFLKGPGYWKPEGKIAELLGSKKAVQISKSAPVQLEMFPDTLNIDDSK